MFGNYPSKRTRILATIGPATGSKEMLRKLVMAGVNVVRINFSHGTPKQREEYLTNIRAVEAELGHPVAVCGDLCGPKIRVGMIREGKVYLVTESEIVIQRTAIEGSASRISTTLPELVDVVGLGDNILLSDGRLRLEVTRVAPPDEFTCRVVIGGELSSGKGVNLPSTDLSVSVLTEKDLDDIEWLSTRSFDFVALSFVQRANDIQKLREMLVQHECDARIIAKVEKPRALQQIDAIIDAADAVMVARGDLGVEMDFPNVPIAQKSIARKCQESATPCIVATEMLESMIQSPTPTRAEVSDIANAVFDHADAVMLSAESSIGKYPVEAVTAMARTVFAAEEYLGEHGSPLQVTVSHPVTTATLAGAIRHIMRAQSIAAVAMFTDTGTTARLISKNRPACPIVAFASEIATVRRCCLYYGVIASKVEPPQNTLDLLTMATTRCKELGIAEPGDRIIVVSGYPIGIRDRTNGLVIEVVE